MSLPLLRSHRARRVVFETMTESSKSILFVCLGNICRSPLAAGEFARLAVELGVEKSFRLDSCGTGDWNIGTPAHPETIRIAGNHGIDLSQHRARQIVSDDLETYDLILAMDRKNLRDIHSLGSAKRGEIKLIREYDLEADDLDVPDPFFGGAEGFEQVYRMLNRSCNRLIEELLKR